MIELNGYDINTRHVAAVGPVACTRAKRYAFEVIFVGSAGALRLTFDKQEDAIAGRARLIADTEEHDAPPTISGRRPFADGPDAGASPRESIIRRARETFAGAGQPALR
ncbi:hypothetical protein [Cognatilysobacter terrigena]|uniref:hypothetical protein n=1 Tax=Cognatilysobacter terrigena TaxID=2488749 RepID=UPI001060C211|nr:hypothetical protein [Lysobacter terrigena]